MAATTRPMGIDDVPAARPSVGPLIPRPRLVHALQDATAPLVLLHAPAGWGKTAVLSQWDEADERAFAWLSLDGPGADPARLADHVRAQLTHRIRRRVLVLDGAHALDDPAFFAFVADLATCQAAGSVIALATRAEPPMALGTLRVRGAVAELDAHALAFTDAESAELLQAAGLHLAPDELAALCGTTRGWAAGLRLATVAVRRQPDARAALAAFGGDDRFVSDYLRETVLAGLAPDVLGFLRHAAILGDLSGPLCDAVLGREGSAELLQTLARAARLVTALDPGERTFRLHPLLASMLAAELERRDAADVRALHARASAWHEARGDVPRALDHAIAAGDATRAGELLWTVAREHASRGRGDAVQSWLERIGDRAVAREPALALSAAVERLAAGDRDRAEHWASLAELRFAEDAGAHADVPRSWRAGLAAVRAGLARGDASRLLADAQRAHALAEDGEWRGEACLLVGVSRRLLGERAEARRALAVAGRGDGVSPTTVRASACSLLALLALEDDDPDGARPLADAAVADAELTRAGVADPAAALAYAASAWTAARSGALERAREHVDRGRGLLVAVPDPPAWLAAESSIALASALLRLSDSHEARMLLSAATRAMGALPDATGLQASLDAAWERVDSFALGALAAPSALTIAELRVLRFLPSHLSLREIATRLHVSANTIKTQAHAVYRKLGVCSRSEAVARAVAIGLVEA